MKSKRKNILIIGLSLFLALFTELFVFQIYSLRGNNKDTRLSEYKLSNVEKKGKYYITTSDKSSVEMEYSGYINELYFNYITKNDFNWDVTVTDKNNNSNSYSFSSASIINTADKTIRYNSKKIKITFYGKNIKFKNIKVHNKIDFNIIRFILIFISSIFIAYLILNKNKFQKNLDKVFLIFSILIGSIYIVSTPISTYTSNDDQVHFHSMYTLLDGSKTEWTYASRYYDKLILNSTNRFTTHEENSNYIRFLLKNDNQNQTVIKNNNRTFGITYNNIIYLPNAIVIKICKLIHLPFVFILLLSKMVNLLMYSFLIFFGIKTIPIGKKLLFSLGILPTSIGLACQFSYDPTIIGSCLLATSILIKMYCDTEIKYKDIFIYTLLITWASLVKAIYCPLFLLPLILFKDKLKDKKERNNIYALLTLLFLVFMSTFVLPALLSSNVSGDSRIEGTSVTLQLKYIMYNPFNYIKILISYSIQNLIEFILGKTTIYNMGYILKEDTSLLRFAYNILMINLLYLTFSEGISEKKINKKTKVFNIIILSIIWVLVATSLYLSWTPVGSQTIKGVQGRYFLPTLLLLLFLIKPTSDSKEENRVLPIIIPMIILIFNVLYVICKFYW